MNKPYSAQLREYLCRKTAGELGLNIADSDKNTVFCDKCCALAFFYGVMLFSRRLSRETMTLSIENEILLEICTYIMIHHFLAAPDVRQVEKGGRKHFEVTFGRELIGRELAEILDSEEKNFSFACKCEKCPGYFVRGAFLASGTMSDPNTAYRAEFVLKERDMALALADFLGDELSPKVIKRKNDHVVYIRGSERLETLCAAIGAQKATFHIIETAMLKDKLNAINRECNFENANMQKTVDASVKVRSAIERLRKSGKYELLSPDLRETAELREKYPSANLAELAALSEKGISRSGLNHRLKKLIELSEE